MMSIIMCCIFSFTWMMRLYEVVGDYICLCAYTLLVIIYVYVHICGWWLYMFMCIYVFGEFSYMLLVLNCWCKHVLKYMLVWIVKVVWIYALLLLSLRSTHSWCWISYPCWWQILCIQLFGVIIRGDYDIFVASWGDNLGGDMVPHVSRVGLGTLYVYDES